MKPTLINFVRRHTAVLVISILSVCALAELSPRIMNDYNEDEHAADILNNPIDSEIQRRELKRALCLEYYALKIEERSIGDTTQTPDDDEMEQRCRLVGITPDMFEYKDPGQPT